MATTGRAAAERRAEGIAATASGHGALRLRGALMDTRERFGN